MGPPSSAARPRARPPRAACPTRPLRCEASASRVTGIILSPDVVPDVLPVAAPPRPRHAGFAAARALPERWKSRYSRTGTRSWYCASRGRRRSRARARTRYPARGPPGGRARAPARRRDLASTPRSPPAPGREPLEGAARPARSPRRSQGSAPPWRDGRRVALVAHRGRISHRSRLLGRPWPSHPRPLSHGRCRRDADASVKISRRSSPFRRAGVTRAGAPTAAGSCRRGSSSRGGTSRRAARGARRDDQARSLLWRRAPRPCSTRRASDS